MAKRTPPVMPRAQRQLRQLGDRLRTARMRREMTQADMAARVGVSVPTIAKLEAGDISTSFSTIIRVLTALGLEADIDHLAKEDALGRELQDSRLRRPPGAGR